MNTIKKKIYLHWKTGEQASNFVVTETDLSILAEYQLIATAEVEFDIGDFDPRETELANLEAAVQQERADSQVRVNILLDRISKLKAISHDAPEAAE